MSLSSPGSFEGRFEQVWSMGRGWSFPSLRDPHLGVFAELSLAEFCKFGWQTPGTETQGRFGPHTGVTSMADLSSPKSPGAHPQLLSPSHLCFSKAPLIFKSLHGLPALPDSAAQSNALTDSKLLKTGARGSERQTIEFLPKRARNGQEKNNPGWPGKAQVLLLWALGCFVLGM